MQYMRYNQICLLCFGIGMLLVIMTTVYLDPCFHYHAPLKRVSYQLNDERYQNNGIVRNFEYDAIITGTSMVQNFKASEMDDIFDVNSIKVAFAGGHFKEINDNLMIALKSNPDTKMVLRCLDINNIIEDKDTPFHGIARQGYVYPYFMNDNNWLNDVSYVLNKEMLIKGLDNVLFTNGGGISTSFDEYSCWNDRFQFGAETVLQTYKRGQKVEIVKELTDKQKKTISDNVKQNVTQVALSNPDVEFYFYYSPYSIVWWDEVNNSNRVEYYIEAMRILAEEALKYENIKLFDFCSNYEVVCNLDNYKDKIHYSAEINSKILNQMKENEYLLTTDNYKEHFEELREFYLNYQYDDFFADFAVVMEEK